MYFNKMNDFIQLILQFFLFLRELGEQEALKKQNQNKLLSADENTNTMTQELEILR